MAVNISLTDLASLENENSAIAAINANNAAIETALQDVLALDGTAPNAMQSQLDMNSYQIINLPAPDTVHSPARLIDVSSNPTIQVPPTGTSGHTVPYLDTNNTWSGINTFQKVDTIGFVGSISGTTTVKTSTVASGTLTLPATTADTLVARNTNDVLTNKSLTSPTITGTLTATNIVTNTNLAQMPATTIKGNSTGGTANAADLTATQATAMLNPFTSSLKGLAPASGGGTANFLRADGTWSPTNATAAQLISSFANIQSFGSSTCHSRGQVYGGFPFLMQDNTIRMFGAGNGTHFYNLDAAAQNTLNVRPITFDTTALPLTGTITKIFSSNGSFYVISSDGKLYCGGANFSGQLGLGDTTGRSRLFLNTFFTSGGLSVTNVFTANNSYAVNGTTVTYFLCSNGQLYSAGYGTTGMLGNGTTTATQSTPVRVGTLTNIVGASCGMTNSATGSTVAWDSGGTAYTWGFNGFGECGTGNTVQQNSPFTVPAITNIVEASSSAGLTQGGAAWGAYIFLRTNAGVLYSAGYNGQGQLGTGSTNNSNAFVLANAGSPPAAASLFLSVSGADSSTGFLTSGGQIWVTGSNISGQLGQGNTNQLVQFTRIGTVTGCTKAMFAGYRGQLALYALIGGVFYSCGYNADGRLGLGDINPRSSLTQVALPMGYTTGDPISDFAFYGDFTTGALYVLFQSGRVLGCGGQTATGAALGQGNGNPTSSYNLYPLTITDP